MIIKVSKNESTDPILFINTESAIAGDYIDFINDIIQLLKEDISSLEKEANANNRTINHHFKGIGSIAKGP